MAALLLALPMGALIQGGQTTSAAAIDYPDLQMIVPTDPLIGPQIYHPAGSPKELRFTHITSNLGDGPLEIKPVYDPVSQTAVGWQNLYKRDSTGKWNLVTSVRVPDVFYWDPAHGHYHFPLASYGLYAVAGDGSVGAPVVMSPKVGFCIGEDVTVNAELVGAPSSIVYNGNTCIDPTAIRGLSVGWGDQYDWMDPGQSIDISSVPDGMYWFRSIADPRANFLEKDRTNNNRDLKIQIAGDTVRVLNPLPSRSGFTFDQSFLQDGNGPLTTPTFTVPAGEVLVAFGSSDGPCCADNQRLTISEPGLNWTLVRRSNAQAGTAEVWTATAATQVTGAVTSTQLNAASFWDQSLTVIALRGSPGIGATTVANGATVAPSVNLTTTQPGSWVVAAGNDPDHPTYRAIGPGQTMIHEWVDKGNARTFWSQAASAPTPAAGTAVQLNDAYPTLNRWNLVAIELLAAPAVPDAPTNVSASPGNATATVSWTAPASGGSAIAKYTVTPYIGSTAQPATDVTGSPPPTSTNIAGLTNSTTYTFKVAATNGTGRGPDSASSNAVTPTAPYAVGVVGTDGGLWVLKSGSPTFTSGGGGLLGAPAVVSIPQTTGPGLPLYLATGTDHDVYVRNDTHPWQRLTTSSFFCIDNPAGAVIGSTLYVACQGSDRALWHAETPAPSGSNLPTVNGNAWQSLGGVLTFGPAVGAVSGTATYAVVGSDQGIYMRTLTTPYAKLDAWKCIGHPALASAGANAYFACHGTDNALYYATNGGSGWGAAVSLGGVLLDGPAIAATSGPVFFVEGGDKALYHRSITGGWTKDGGVVQFGVGAAGL